jgi:glycosyltransferase involved in cell wall biosynthesis
MNNKKPTICFVTICKNEEHCILQALESVYKHINYWVICDTGSTDRTPELIKSFFEEKGIPGELYIDEWVDFGYNKSLMMERAANHSDYIMHFDADDILIGDFLVKEEEMVHDSYFMTVKRGGSEWKALILFNGKKIWKFCGVAHTTIIVIGQNGFSIGDFCDKNFHVLAETVGARSFDPKKYFYDAEKLQKQFFDTLVDDPYDLNYRSVFYTAQSYMDCGMWKESLMWYRLYAKLKNTWTEEEFESRMRISKCLMMLNESPEKIKFEMDVAIKMFEDRAEPFYYLGEYFNSIGDFENGYYHLSQAKTKDIEKIKEKYVLFINSTVYGKNVNYLLALSCLNTKRYLEGYKLVIELFYDSNYHFMIDSVKSLLNDFESKLS